jgi:hypothetical protein
MMMNDFSAAFCGFIAKTCILLFFSVLASKLRSLLIMNAMSETQNSNEIQREFDSNVRIATFGISPAPKRPRQKTNFFKQKLLSLCFCSLPQCFGEGLGMGVRAADTNQIQREFLFNNCIQSQNISSASKPPRQNTNLFKQKSPSPSTSLRVQWGGARGGVSSWESASECPPCAPPPNRLAQWVGALPTM